MKSKRVKLYENVNFLRFIIGNYDGDPKKTLLPHTPKYQKLQPVCKCTLYISLLK